MTTIGLCMIVKNEEHVIERCLNSVRPLINYVLVCDTGSTDNTQEIIERWMDDCNVNGLILHDKWVDFGHNRSLALKALRGYQYPGATLGTAGIDYTLMMDADDQLIIDQGLDIAAWKASLTADMYDVLVEHGPILHWRPHIYSNRKEFRYRGVLHEFAEGPPGHTRGRAPEGLRIRAGVEGHRSSNPDKYHDDAKLLERALATETDETMRQRYAFYLAQSHKDAGENTVAMIRYLDRAEMGGWEGEVYVSLLRASQLMEAMPKASGESIIGKYLRAFEADPTRTEALQAATRYCHRTGRHHQGYLIGRHGVMIPEPDGKLFPEPWVYEWGMHDDFSVAAYWSGHYQESFDSASKALEHAPPEHRQRITDNVRFAKERLNDNSNLIRDVSDGDGVDSSRFHKNDNKEGDRSGDRETGQVDFTVVAVELAGYIHSGAYAELAETMLYGLRALEYTAELRDDTDWHTINGRIILIGAHLLAGGVNDCIIYNTEHFNRVAEGPATYRTMLKHPGITVWDYSEENARQLTKMLGRPVKYVPVGYVPELTRIEPAAVQDIDVLFYGSYNERRSQIIHSLRAGRSCPGCAGHGYTWDVCPTCSGSGKIDVLKVETLFGVYGAERDAYIARAKVVLCMHYHTPGVFEAVRVSYLLANKKAVVCEWNEGEKVEPLLIPGVTLVPYEGLVAACQELVTFGDRKTIEETAFTNYQTCLESKILRTALRRKVWDCFLYNGEADVLAIRLHELKDVVDRFVIVEADTTFSGQEKDPSAKYQSKIWKEFHNKIVYVLVDDVPETGNPWERERHQRNAISRGLTEASADDLIMISDVDEIPRATVVEEMANDHRHEAFGLRLAFYYFLLNYQCTAGSEANKVWNCAVTKRILDGTTPDAMRYLAQTVAGIVGGSPSGDIIDDAGWHFSYLGDDEAVRAKVRAFSHQEYNIPEVLDNIDIQRMVREGKDLFGRPGYGWWLVNNFDELPEWVKSQPEMIERWTR